jgi:hypothetical protein
VVFYRMGVGYGGVDMRTQLYTIIIVLSRIALAMVFVPITYDVFLIPSLDNFNIRGLGYSVLPKVLHPY